MINERPFLQHLTTICPGYEQELQAVLQELKLANQEFAQYLSQIPHD